MSRTYFTKTLSPELIDKIFSKLCAPLVEKSAYLAIYEISEDGETGSRSIPVIIAGVQIPFPLETWKCGSAQDALDKFDEWTKSLTLE